MLSSSHSTSPDPALSLVKATTACREGLDLSAVAENAPQNSGRERDSLIRAEISLIARFKSLQGRKKFPVPMRRELACKYLVQLLFLLAVGCAPSAK
jgi:hypothetical protein